MLGSACVEMEIKVGANEAWRVFGSLLISRLMIEKHPEISRSMVVLEGDGGTGTLIQLTLPSGGAICKERYYMVDDEKRIKLAKLEEGGYLDLGFTYYRVRVEVIENEKDENLCRVRYSADYEVKEEAAANASFFSMQPYVTRMILGAAFLTNKVNII